MSRTRLVAVLSALLLVAALAGLPAAAGAKPGSPSRPLAATGASSATGRSGASSAASGSTASGDPVTVSTRAAAAAATSGCTDTSNKSYATGLPPLPCLPNPFSHTTQFFDYGVPFSPVTQQVRKAKVTIALPPLRVRAFDVVCSTSFPPVFPACPFDPHYPATDLSVTPGYFGTFASAWVQSPAGVAPQFGVFPTVKVALLAFGSIPVTAEVHIRQPESHGLSSPFTLNWLQSETVVTPGKEIPGFPQYGRAPKATASGGGYFWSPPAHLSGPIVITLSDVAIDGVALPVGSSCRTSTTLSLGAPGGFYPSNAPPMRDKPGGYAPLYNGLSYLSGELCLPAFSGCHHGAEDLDPLITGTVSGPNNRIDVTQTASLTPYGCLVDPSDPNCATQHPALQRAALAAETPAQRAALAKAALVQHAAIKTLPARVRKLLGQRLRGTN